MTLNQIKTLRVIADTHGLSAHYIPSTDVSSGDPLYVDGVRMGGKTSWLEDAEADPRNNFEIQRWGIGYFFYRDIRPSSSPRRVNKTRLAAIAKIMPIEAD